MHKKLQNGLLVTIFIFFLSFFQPCYGAVASGVAIGATVATTLGLVGIAVAFLFNKDDTKKSTTTPEDKSADISAQGVLLTEPKTSKNLVITNGTTNKTVKIISVVLGNGIFDVTGGTATMDPSCQAIAPKGTCNVAFTANSQDSYGSSSATITYNNGTTTKTAQATVGVANTTLTLTDLAGKDVTSDIILPYPAPQTADFQYKVSGKFNWQNPKVAWKTTFDPFGGDPEYYAALTNNTCTGDKIDVNGTCAFTFSVKKDHPGDWGIIQTSGTNVNTHLTNVLAGGGLAIIINEDENDKHLVYRSIKLVNTIDPKGGNYGNIWISDISFPTTTCPKKGDLLQGPDALVKYCAKGDSDCDYQTDCKIFPGTTFQTSLTPKGTTGSSCKIWFKANTKKDDTSKDLPLQVTPDTTIGEPPRTIEVIVSGAKKLSTGQMDFEVNTSTCKYGYENECTFSASYNKSLYVAGIFQYGVLDGGERILLSNIGRWNDADLWQPLASGMNNVVNTLAIVKGDLYAGGNFNSAGTTSTPFVARWNGSTWSPMGKTLSQEILCITDMNMAPCVGDTSGGIYQWNWQSSGWDSIGNTNINNAVLSLFYDKGSSILYATGSFTSPSFFSYVAQRDSNGNWSKVGDNTINNMGLALIKIGTNLYVGGAFFGSPFNNVAKLDLTSGTPTWQPVGLGFAEPAVYAFAEVNNVLYSGGSFMNTSDYSIILNYVATLQNNAWTQMPSGSYPGFAGGDGFVHALTGMYTDVDTSVVYAGGSFFNDNSGSTYLNNIARWDGKKWNPIGEGIQNDTSNPPLPYVYELMTTPALNIIDYYTVII